MKLLKVLCLIFTKIRFFTNCGITDTGFLLIYKMQGGFTGLFFRLTGLFFTPDQVCFLYLYFLAFVYPPKIFSFYCYIHSFSDFVTKIFKKNKKAAPKDIGAAFLCKFVCHRNLLFSIIVPSVSDWQIDYCHRLRRLCRGGEAQYAEILWNALARRL